MALADRYRKPDTRTKFERWLDDQSEKNRDIIIGWLTDPDIPNNSIAQWIRSDEPEDGFTGYRASKDTISEWRRHHGAR